LRIIEHDFGAIFKLNPSKTYSLSALFIRSHEVVFRGCSISVKVLRFRLTAFLTFLSSQVFPSNTIC